MDANQFVRQRTEIGIRQVSRTTATKRRIVRLGNPTLADCPVVVPPPAAARAGMMYVYSDIDGTINVEQALNDGVFTTWSNDQRHLEVVVGYPPGSSVLTILSLGPTALDQTGGASPQQMAQAAALNVTPDKMQQLRLIPQTTPDLTLRLTGGVWIQNNTIVPVAAIDEIDFAASVPGTTGEARYTHVAVDSTGATVLTDGTAFVSASEVNPVEHLVTTFPVETDSIGWVRLENGQTAINNEHIIPAPSLYFGLGVVPPALGGSGVDASGYEGYIFYNNGTQYQVRIIGQQTSAPTVNDDSGDLFIVGSQYYTHQSSWTCLDNTLGAAVWTSGVFYSAANVSNPPTDAELDALFGTPASAGAGFSAVVNDAGADTNVYLVSSTGSSWFYTAMTQAV